MELEFRKLGRGEKLPQEGQCQLVAFLRPDDWDDYTFKTSFALTVFDESGVRIDIGGIKIGYFGQEERSRTEIPKQFTVLAKKFFSLGQSAEYYHNIQLLDVDLKKNILSVLRDIVADEKWAEIALKEEVTKKSLLRDVSVSSIKGQFSRLLSGGALRTEYHFMYRIGQGHPKVSMEMDFHVDPEAHPPTNIHVLIGRNGVGKTYLLNNMVRAIADDSASAETVGKFIVTPGLDGSFPDEFFAGVVSVTFSAFDPFDPLPEEKDKSKGVRYSYVGLKRSTNRGGERGTPMSHDMLTNEYVKSFLACISLGKAERWKLAVQTLESDPLFKDADLTSLAELKDEAKRESQAKSKFKKLSSGHRIVLLTITKLVEKVEEKTLVLIDELEGHLHPPLLSAFVRALSDLLSYRNGVAIIATHSPVVVQEVPKSCVWKLHRTGQETHVERPEIETFGENVGILTRETFGLEVTESGYHDVLKAALKDEASYESILEYFEEQLGSEARAILRGLFASKERSES